MPARFDSVASSGVRRAIANSDHHPQLMTGDCASQELANRILTHHQAVAINDPGKYRHKCKSESEPDSPKTNEIAAAKIIESAITTWEIFKKTYPRQETGQRTVNVLVASNKGGAWFKLWLCCAITGPIYPGRLHAAAQRKAAANRMIESHSLFVHVRHFDSRTENITNKTGPARGF